MTQERPLLGLLVDRSPDPTATDLIVSLARWVRPIASMRLTPREPPSAWFATSVSAAARADRDRPLAIWVDQGELDETTRAGAVLVGPAAPDCSPHVRVLRGAADLERWPWFPPFVRGRHRRRLGLPDTPIDVRACAPNPIPGSDVATALALAPAALVDEAWLLVALALGTPCATTEDVASSVLPEHVHEAVTIGSPDELDELASSLATGPDQARRSWAARMVASTLDLTQVARRLARSLGIVCHGGPHHLDSRLAELGTGAESLAAQRARAAVGTLPMDKPEANA